MTYLTIAVMKDDPWLRARVAACVSQEAVGRPVEWALQNAWELAAQPGWASAWESALVTHAGEPDYEPGKDGGVISDQMILAAVQTISQQPE